MAVAVQDACVADHHGVNAQTIDKTDFTVTSGAELLILLVGGGAIGGSPWTSVSATWDQGGSNQAMTKVASTTATIALGLTEIWVLLNPTTGNKTLRYDTGTSQNYRVMLGLLTVVGNDGTTPTQNGATNSGTSNAPTVTVTTAANNMTFAVSHDDGGFTWSAASQTVLFNSSPFYGQTGSRGSGGAGPDTHSWSLSGSPNWCMSGCDVIAASGGGGTSWGPLLALRNNRLVGV